MNTTGCDDCLNTDIHGIRRLERHGECARFKSDDEAQAFAAVACKHHDALVQMLGRLIEYLNVAGDDGAYEQELKDAVQLLHEIRHL